MTLTMIFVAVPCITLGIFISALAADHYRAAREREARAQITVWQIRSDLP